MKYFLAIDKGEYLSNADRFVNVDLKSIDSRFDKNNNLQALCIFTTSFEKESELKFFLMNKNLMYSKYANYPLVFIYKRNYYRALNVPYKAHLDYLNFHYLENKICKCAKNPNFLHALTKYYVSHMYLNQELNSLRSYLSNPYADYKLYDVIRNFVDKICFKIKNGVRVINFRGLLDLSLFIYKFSSSNVSINSTVNNTELFKDSFEHSYFDEDDPRLFHYEELQARARQKEESQISFF